jgi:hypothetical protein
VDQGRRTRRVDGGFKCVRVFFFYCFPFPIVLPHSDTDTRQVYALHLQLADYLVRGDGGKFDRERYRSHPEEFSSVFHSKVRYFSFLPLSPLPRFCSLLPPTLDRSFHNSLPQRQLLGSALSSPSHHCSSRRATAKPSISPSLRRRRVLRFRGAFHARSSALPLLRHARSSSLPLLQSH